MNGTSSEAGSESLVIDFDSTPISTSQTRPQDIPSSPPYTNGNGSGYLNAYDAGSSAILGTSPTRTTTGKSGRVIEKLMAENDRLRRELKVETTAREEERKAKEAIRQARDFLQSTNDNLILQNNIDKSSLARKDRKIDELKAERDFEREQRLELDERSMIQIRESDSQVQDLKNMMSRSQAERELAVNQYNVVREEFRRLDDSYRQRIERLQVHLTAISAERERDHKFLQQLEVIVEQQRQELEKLRLAKNKITDKCGEVIEQADSEMARIKKMAITQERKLDETVESAQETLFALRRLIGVEKAFRPSSTESTGS
ncbi:hypothetical protein BZA05DRAFT_446084 [Tricharina praecox]|uniref:uncharacterized protein n=1 Tax=Tricharina praecox TaxID=43433 RepID=UPI00221FE880|nr:uncharacterized protein BZA05DRAFT_446084 [Tricharina praecox]KAI5848996.1 hypothetical protein BZA05DRAFT_446084 [Tricharina praecox]